MENNTKQLTFDYFVNASPAQVYRAFTNSSSLREWLCNFATTDPKPGGRIYMWWNSGYYTSGEFISLVENKKISFTWFGRGEPYQTNVEIIIKEKDGGTQFNLVHSGIGTSPKWETVISEYKKGWNNGLENLISVLETGPDLRIVRRPMLGIMVNDFNEEIAEKLGIPITEGIRIDNPIAGMGAELAGLIKDDVIIGMGGGRVTNFSSLSNILNGFHAGDVVSVEFYRGAQKQSVEMTLSGRQIPEIPSTGKEMSDAVRNIYNQVLNDLEEFLHGVSDEEAAYKPAEKEWSINEIICHLIHGEDGTQVFIEDLIGGHEAWHDDYGGNIQERIDATLVVYPNQKDLFNELKRSTEKTLAMLANLPEEFLERKGSYWRLGFFMLEGPYHFNLHKAQMQATLESARSH